LLTVYVVAGVTSVTGWLASAEATVVPGRVGLYRIPTESGTVIAADGAWEPESPVGADEMGEESEAAAFE
jgi:hypothetical protein